MPLEEGKTGGGQQRVALARSIVMEPKVLLLDEPLSAIDARLRKSLQISIKQITKDLGLTSVFVTHDQDEAMVMSDVIHLFHDGRIEQSGEPVENGEEYQFEGVVEDNMPRGNVLRYSINVNGVKIHVDVLFRSRVLFGSGDNAGLFISVMSFAMCDVDAVIFHMVDQPVFIIDTAAVLTLKIALEEFGFSDTFSAPIAFNIFNKLVDTFYCFFVLNLPIEIIFPGIIRPDLFTHPPPQSVHVPGPFPPGVPGQIF